MISQLRPAVEAVIQAHGDACSKADTRAVTVTRPAPGQYERREAHLKPVAGGKEQAMVLVPEELAWFRSNGNIYLALGLMVFDRRFIEQRTLVLVLGTLSEISFKWRRDS